MKKTFLILFFLLLNFYFSYAKTYYISNAGNDSNTGLSTSAPWKTLSKVNSFKGFVAGDQILFNRGETFYGSLSISSSGSSGNPILFSAYGSGAKPIITGFKAITSWSSLGSNIWESTSSVSSLSYTNMVTVNNINTPMGRYPNSTTTLPYQSNANGTTITSSSLTGSTNWTGAELALYISTYRIGRNKITAQSGGTLTYVYNANDGPIQNAPNWFYPSFFIQNDPRTLDSQNEWYYDPGTKKLKIYNTTTPSNVSISTVDTLVSISGKSYVTLDNLMLTGGNKIGICVINSQHITAQNCDINFTGRDGIFGPYNGKSPNFTVQNCTISNSNNTAIDISGDFTNAVIQNNTLLNSGMIQGMGENSSSNGTGSSGGIYAFGTGNLISGNTITNIGYIGIKFYGNNTIVKNNFVQNFCEVLVDGGGIYTVNSANSTNSGMKIQNNIVLNSPADNGIYLDEKSNGVEVSGNSIAYTNWAIYLHNDWNVSVTNNTTYNNGQRDGAGVYINNYDPTVITSNITIKNNILVAKGSKQNTGYFSLLSGFPSSLYVDSNYYARPIDDNSTIFTNLAHVYNYYPLSTWQTLSGFDLHSKKSPLAVKDTSNLTFVYNPTSASKTISLNGTFIDVKNKSYNGSITLSAYSSAVLIKTGSATNTAPVANAGSDQYITLPTNSVLLSGSGQDGDGTISSYFWTKISGPSSGSIGNASGTSTHVTDLVQGVYQFQLRVIDNVGSSDYDTVQVTVSAANTTLLPALNISNLINGIDYRYYSSGINGVIPAFSSLNPAIASSASNFDISSAGTSNYFAFCFTGYISVPTDGVYTFYTNSDDGSNLYIDNNLIVNNDGLHALDEASGTIGLKAGLHYIQVGYFQQTGDEQLSVSYAGPGVSKKTIPSSVLYHNDYSLAASRSSFNSNITAISDPAAAEAKAYPNPFLSSVNVTIPGNAGTYKIVVANVIGQIVLTKSGSKSSGYYLETLNTSALERGVYFIKIIKSDNTSSTIKVEKH